MVPGLAHREIAPPGPTRRPPPHPRIGLTATVGTGFTAILFTLTVLGAMLGERAGVQVQWRDKRFSYTMASPFLLAILALWGLPAALLAAIAASLLDDLADRSSLEKTAFNLGQASLALGMAGLVYGLLADEPVTSWHQLPAFGAAAVVNLTASELAVRVVVLLERQAAHAPTSS